MTLRFDLSLPAARRAGDGRPLDRIKFVIALTVLVVLASSPAVAQDAGQGFREAISAHGYAALLQEWGYRAEIDTFKSGRPYIQSSVGGSKFNCIFYDPTEGDEYEDIQFSAWFDESFEGTVVDANEWNMKKRHALAVYDKSDGMVGLQVDLTLKGGVTDEFLKSYVAMWEMYLMSFKSYLADAH